MTAANKYMAGVSNLTIFQRYPITAPKVGLVITPKSTQSET